ncbi:hypothetical protein BJX99DRAFT_271463 [Aspergillus californicus]
MSASPFANLSSGARLYLFNHVFLPPRLPQESDYNAEHDLTLLDTVIHSLHGFRSSLSDEQGNTLVSVIAAISRLRKSHGVNGGADEAKLKELMRGLDTAEAFELSPTNVAVNTTVGRLRRRFPGPTFSMGHAAFNEPGLQVTIAQTLTKLSHQSAPGTQPRVKKAGQKHDEERDTTNPKMVTEFFMAFLRPRCNVLDNLQIQKNTREEVLWSKTLYPWRRSPLWLLIRVVLQLTLRRIYVGEIVLGDIYKQFMVYYMSVVLDECSKKICDEDCYMMTAKISRRLHKLDLTHRPAWFSYVQHALQKGNDAIQKSWRSIMAKNSLLHDKLCLTELDFTQDTHCLLPDLDKWVESIDARKHSPGLTKFQPSSTPYEFPKTELPLLLCLANTYALAALEKWVNNNLETWLRIHLPDEDTCQQMRSLITQYHSVAFPLYSCNPEAVSVMLLTILELWIACDKAGIHHHPMLGNYDAHIRMGVFESLVLPYRSQLERLARAEDYMRQRQQRLVNPESNIFQDFGTSSCFSVKYFDQSSEHQTLLATIEDRARRDRAAKRSELHQKQQKYTELMALIDEMQCTYVDVVVDTLYGYTESRHCSSCRRCALITEANSISINVHEWPLPANSLEAKTTVFELKVPSTFSSWRDTTIFFLVTVLNVNYSIEQRPRAQYRPETYSGLSSFFIPAVNANIGLLSQDKPHECTHRQKKKIIDVIEMDICLVNGMNFGYFDNLAGTFVVGFKATDKTEILCTYKVPQLSSSLQQYLFRPANKRDGPPPNTVIASQHACPQDMSLEEYKGLCSMSFGIEIQWLSILRQLAMPSVVFKKVETCIFILQIIRQVGPSKGGSILRAGHSVLENDNFAIALLAEIKTAAGRIKENWESAHELNALIVLTQRVLTLTTSAAIQDLCLGHLSHLRSMAFGWVNIVRAKASNTDSDTARNDLIAQSAHLALICISTFDSEGIVLERILESELDASIFIQCCMIVHDRKGLLDMAPGSLLLILYYQWQILTYRCYGILAYNIVQLKKTSMDHAIREGWAAYQTGSPWTVAPGGGNYWLVTQMMSGSSHVHFNLLTGQLLINGRPLARLPSEYEGHKTYKTLFGQSLVEVMPSEVPGMQFSGQRKHINHTIHVGMEPISGAGGADLCVRAVNEDQSWEFVPARLLIGAFPDFFVEAHAHWYNFEGGFVEFRPIKWCLVKGDVSLVSPIEKASRLHFKLHASTSLLEIEVPRLRLNFQLRSGHTSVQSRQYRGMLIDPDQSLDTLVGLRNKLILRHENGHDRMVLIPQGAVTWEKEERHVAVKICWQAGSNPHVYTVDSQIGRLVDNGSMQSKLMLSYLHAVTSHYLQTASMRSFSRLQPENTEMLVKLAELTPTRTYYPENKRVMQSISWQKSLACLTHHGNFREQVETIFDQDCRMKMFYPDSGADRFALPAMDKNLLLRDQIRSSSFRTSSFGAEGHTPVHDRSYSERGQDHLSEGCSRVMTLCKIIHEGIPSTREITPEALLSCLWLFLSQFNEAHGPDLVVQKAKIHYDAIWLLDQGEFVSTNWCNIHRLLCSDTSPLDKHRVMIWLSALAFSEKIQMTVLETLAALFVIPSMGGFMPPSLPSCQQKFQPKKGYEMSETILKTDIRPAMLSVTPESSLSRLLREKYTSFQYRVNRERENNRAQALNQFIASLRDQWPTLSPSTPDFQGSPRFEDYFNTQIAMTAVRKAFSNWFCNRELREYLARIASNLSSQSVSHLTMPSFPPPSPAQPAEPAYRKRGFVHIDDVLDISLGPSPSLEKEQPQFGDLLHAGPGTMEHAPRLLALVEGLEQQAKSSYEKLYVRQLQGSTNSLQQLKQTDQVVMNDSELEKVISGYLLRCEAHFRKIQTAILSRMRLSVIATDVPAQERSVYCEVLETLANINIGPRFSPELILQKLTRQRWSQLPREWQDCFIAYGRSITALQWAHRLVNKVGHREDLLQELRNPGHTNWDPYTFPESLLLEIENGILIRDVQEQIAQQMRHIQTRQNVVMQLNMGEGKSSVIVPIVAAALANGSCLVRVLVAKPQSQQMFQMLVSKLGGLMDRRVYHLPVSRSLMIGDAEAREIERMCLECMIEGGILFVQPEHILSLKLKCLECFIAGKETIGHNLLKTLMFFRASSRDVVDESDENFSVKFELIYTMGSQLPLELSPQRWVLIQQLLDLVRNYALAIKKKFPQSIDVDEQEPGSFPRIRLHHEDAAQELFKEIAEHICKNGIGSLPIPRQSKPARRAILSYILCQTLSVHEIAAVEDSSATSFWTPSTKDPLLLLRGLLAGGVLGFCFGQKRWRVNFGPDRSRIPPTRLSVPYRAKDSPAPRSEFSHPDVVILLTCLSYYYAGLDNDELFLAFQHLIKSDQADTEYLRWIEDAPKLSRVYRQLGGINLIDRQHCLDHIFPDIRFSKGAIDYFLAHAVFPKEMKEFPSKLSASGWDVGEIKTLPTGGFSGTNDSRKTLPLSVKQLDLPEQNHTNALVLEYLLRSENSSSSDAQVLLDMVVSLKPPVQLTNLEVAETWLNMIPEDGQTQAVVFVNDSDEICVISPFAKQLGACIDLKLPQSYRAAVTLGAGITKDKLVQACMRMRKLGKGYEYSINTWVEMQRTMPLWAIQGERFERQNHIWQKVYYGDQVAMSKSRAEEFLEPESQSIEQRYRRREGDSPVITSESETSENIRLISERCREFSNLNFFSTHLQEEQERQLAPEIVQERQIQRPASANPEKHCIHSDLRLFVSTGVVKESSGTFKPAFEALRNTSAATHLDMSQFPSELLVTDDFAKTVQKSTGVSMFDAYQRPVQWVLTSNIRSPPNRKTVKSMIIISPYEANALHPEILLSRVVTMHMYAPRQNRSFLSLDKLVLYNVPPGSAATDIPTTLRIQLNLFAGQLYIASFDEYRETCKFLGVASTTTPAGMTVAADGFIMASNQQSKTTSFTQSPLKFLQLLMSQIRKDGQAIDKTHLGKLVDGKLLCMNDFEHFDDMSVDID